MILAAGLGKRMRPLTDKTPKPLLKVQGKPLLQHHIEKLASAGIKELIINHARMGAQIESYFGVGKSLGVNIQYSAEGDSPLETGGGIKQALPLIDDEVFVVINADIWTDYEYACLPANPSALAHLVMVDNPAHHPQGDFHLHNNRLSSTGDPRLTYSGIGVFRSALFDHCEETVFPLAPVLVAAMEDQQIHGEYFSGRWLDIGTPERLSELNK